MRFSPTRSGGILDDLMVANRGDHLFLVVNAACKDADLAHLRAHLPPHARSSRSRTAPPRAAGPGGRGGARAARAGSDLRFMDVAVLPSGGEIWVSRSGYTGEDGFEISVPAAPPAGAFAEALLAQDGVAPIGLGARDSLRLEAGLCLYGTDLDETTSPARPRSAGRSRRSAAGAATARAASPARSAS
jgi:aminomethyltransferase